ncbi:NAD(P)H-dependent oxidoreductase [Luteococcus peritonei]|uniref:NADPH-dependent FMN reductase n=1 Tax=Luteococcus peritonei TaxID=88874 RepID=A0ABW4RUY7_9ACTN
MKIGIILGSIRDNRAGEAVAQWVLQNAPQSSEVSYELVDVKDYELEPLHAATPPAAAGGTYSDPRVQKWGDKIAEFDGFVFVSAEYNHGVPGVFKNAVDSIGVEWMHKPVAFVSYGAAGGVLAVENWRTVLANFNVYDLRDNVQLSLFTDFGDQGFAPDERHQQPLQELFTHLEQVAGIMQPLRSQD